MRRPLSSVAVVVLLLCVAVFLLAPSLLVGTLRNPLTRTPADVSLAFETVTFPAADDAVAIRAWWIPAASPAGAIVLVHGGGSNRSAPFMQGLELARDLHRMGYDVLLPDLRNHGESPDAPGGRLTFGIEEARDVVGAVDFLETRRQGLAVAAIGFSMGGSTVLHAAARDPRIRAVVTSGAPNDFLDPTLVNGGYITGLPHPVLRAALFSAELQGRMQMPRRVSRVAAELTDRAVLFVHNEADPIVPVEQARRFARSLPSGSLWITKRPPDEHPMWKTAGPWGTHVRSYVLYPTEFVARVTALLRRAFDAS